MTATTAVAAPASAWTLVYTAAGTVKVAVANNSPSVSLRVRIGSAAVVGDPETAGHLFVHPLDNIVLDSLVSTDKIYVRPIGPDAGACSVWGA